MNLAAVVVWLMCAATWVYGGALTVPGGGGGLPTVGGTMTGQVVFSGVSTDVSTGSGEDFTVAPAGAGKMIVSSPVEISASNITPELKIRDTNAAGFSSVIMYNSADATLSHFGGGNSGAGAPWANNTFVIGYGTTPAGKVLLSAVGNHAAGEDAIRFYKNTTTQVGAVDGNGAYRFPDKTSAHGATCNSGNEGLIYYRSISGSNKSGFCVCAETSSGVYAWKMGMTFGSSALTDGDC